MRTSTLLRPAIALSSALLLTACEHLQQPEAPGHNHVVLVDISGSALQDLGLHAEEIERRILRRMGPKDRLVVLPIDDASLTHAKPAFELDLSTKDFVDPSLPVTVRQTVAEQSRADYLKRVASSFKGRLEAAAEERRKSRHLTDIFGALRKAADEVRPDRSNQLWLLCDMLHESRELNLYQMQKAGKALESARSKAPRMELRFDRVLVFTGDNSKLGAQRYAELESFWRAWFTEQGLPVGAYTSGGIRLDIAQQP